MHHETPRRGFRLGAWLACMLILLPLLAAVTCWGRGPHAVPVLRRVGRSTCWAGPTRPGIATVTGVQGLVEVKSLGAKSWTAVKGTRSLAEGDAIRVGKEGRALLLQPGSPARALKASEVVLVSARRRWREGVGRQPLTSAQHRSVFPLLESAGTSSRSQGTLVRAHRVGEEIALSPRFENVLDGHPTFVRAEAANERGAGVEVYRGETLVWRQKNARTSLAYLPDVPPLRPARYTWQVYVTLEGSRQQMDGAEFTVRDPGRAARVRAEVAAARELVPDATTVNLALVGTCVTHRLLTPAEAAPRGALAAAPEDATLYTLLAHVSLAGRTHARDGAVKAARSKRNQ